MDITVPKVGDIIEGKVIIVTDNTIFLDISYFTEARMHLDNFDPSLDSFEGAVKVGDVIKGRIQKIQFDEPALILMSRLPLIRVENFEKIQAMVESKETALVKVTKILDKGIIATYLTYEVFIPYTLLDFELIENKEALKGKELEVNIIEASKRGRFTRIVGSRKEIFEQARKEAFQERIALREEELATINTGDVLTGTVDKLDKHAANIKFDNIIGMLRISQVSHHRIDKIDDVLSLGDEVQVKVIKKEGNRLDLSMKALIPTPFEVYVEENGVGDKVTGTIHQKLPFGLIVELAQDVRGLLHKNEYSWNPNDNLDSVVKIGEEIELSIINVDKKRKRIGLSKKVLEDNPWKNVNVRRGDVLENIVVKEVTDRGLNVEVLGVDAFIPAGDALLQQGSLEAYFSVGDTIEEALVIDANQKTWSLTLSVKRLQERKDRESFEKYLESDDSDQGQTIGDLFEDELIK